MAQRARQTDGGAAAGVAIDWSAALAEHDRWLRTVAFSRLRDADAVDEIMQEVSLAAVRQAAPLEDPTKVAPWLYRLVVRQVLLYRRKMGRRRKLTERYANRFQPSEEDRAADPRDWLLAGERRALVRACVECLPPRDAEILLLKYGEDWSYHQIADHLDISHSAVEARLHRARGRLRKQLATRGVIETPL